MSFSPRSMAPVMNGATALRGLAQWAIHALIAHNCQSLTMEAADLVFNNLTNVVTAHCSHQKVATPPSLEVAESLGEEERNWTKTLLKCLIGLILAIAFGICWWVRVICLTSNFETDRFRRLPKCHWHDLLLTATLLIKVVIKRPVCATLKLLFDMGPPLPPPPWGSRNRKCNLIWGQG